MAYAIARYEAKGIVLGFLRQVKRSTMTEMDNVLPVSRRQLYNVLWKDLVPAGVVKAEQSFRDTRKTYFSLVEHGAMK